MFTKKLLKQNACVPVELQAPTEENGGAHSLIYVIGAYSVLHYLPPSWFEIL